MISVFLVKGLGQQGLGNMQKRWWRLIRKGSLMMEWDTYKGGNDEVAHDARVPCCPHDGLFM